MSYTKNEVIKDLNRREAVGNPDKYERLMEIEEMKIGAMLEAGLSEEEAERMLEDIND